LKILIKSVKVLVKPVSYDKWWIETIQECALAWLRIHKGQ